MQKLIFAALAALAVTGCANVPIFARENVVVEGDASWQVAGQVRYILHDATYSGSIGRLALYVEVPVHPRFQFHYGIEHRSLIETGGDRGEERAIAGFKWQPWGAR